MSSEKRTQIRGMTTFVERYQGRTALDPETIGVVVCVPIRGQMDGELRYSYSVTRDGTVSGGPAVASAANYGAMRHGREVYAAHNPLGDQLGGGGLRSLLAALVIEHDMAERDARKVEATRDLAPNQYEILGVVEQAFPGWLR
jgi:hypothetical protein